jgi:hypothetical protein
MSGPLPVPGPAAEVYRMGCQQTRGSGRHLSGGLVLTARHVVGDAGDQVTVLAQVAAGGWQHRADQRGRPELPLAEALDVRAELLNRLGKPREARADAGRAAKIRTLHADPARGTAEDERDR